MGNSLAEDIQLAREGDDEIKNAVYERETAASLDMSGMSFQDVRFVGCRFISCDMERAAFYGCTFDKCDFSNIHLRECYCKD